MNARNALMFLIFASCLDVSYAATVGTCTSDKHPYATISSAVAAASPGEIVNVCPGTYAEQIQIDIPLTLQSVQGLATIVPPASGMNEIPTGSGSFPQIYINNSVGQVKLSALAVNGNNASFNAGFGVPLSANAACQDGIADGFVGVWFGGPSGIVDGLVVSGQYGSVLTLDDEGPQLIPNCGSGIEFHVSGQAFIQNTVVSGVGLVGISGSNLMANTNQVQAGLGPYGIGIAASGGTIINNNVAGTSDYVGTIGIEGGDSVKNNNVQNAIYGIVGAANASHNTLTDNAISISKVADASNNLISGASTYYNPACFNGGCNPNSLTGPAYPTIGLDLGCANGGAIKNNRFDGLGIGIANVEAGQTISKTNLFSSVTTNTTSCSQ